MMLITPAGADVDTSDSQTCLEPVARNVSPIRPKRRRLTLLQLPADVLELILGQLSHTNDFCALALTCSALHAFAVPHIYSRFDIVWPDASAQVASKSDVDALTYGLSTLTMAEEVFGQAASSDDESSHREPYRCTHCGHFNARPATQRRDPDARQRKRRRYGNAYAQYCKKISLGNGPEDWVQDYSVAKEAGKLLGTQVALAVARMRNLESFVWDMPTGVVREVWVALASLGDGPDWRPCKLERVWVRWHNKIQLLKQAEGTGDDDGGVDGDLDADNNGGDDTDDDNTERFDEIDLTTSSDMAWVSRSASKPARPNPTFSLLPPLKSLSVLDIDGIECIEEMASLIGRSRHRLRELRIGIASYVAAYKWQSFFTPDSIQLDSQSSTALDTSPGILNVLFAQIFRVTTEGIARDPVVSADKTISASSPQQSGTIDSPDENASTGADGEKVPNFAEGEQRKLTIREKQYSPALYQDEQRLKLEVLELERVPLAVFTLREALDWTKLTDITLLDCQHHERFWLALHRQFSPPSASQGLTLRKIHVNSVTQALVSFIRDVLPRDTLQTAFLQASHDSVSRYWSLNTPTVTLDAIFRVVVRRHARSLKKLLIDSGLHHLKQRNELIWRQSRKHWTLSRDVLSFVTSGQMPALRELAVCLRHRDWHFFLQRLPSLSQLRSLYIPQLLNHDTGNPINEESDALPHVAVAELPAQILDVIILRPEIQLCYLGMLNRCYEILETDVADDDTDDDDDDDNSEYGSPHASAGEHGSAASAEDSDNGGDDELDSDDSDDLDASDEHDSDDDNNNNNDDSGGPSGGLDSARQLDAHNAATTTRIRLREILFYDDKVAIFKARHSRL